MEELTIDFGEQGQFTYWVPAFKYLKMPPEELERERERVRKEMQKELALERQEREKAKKNCGGYDCCAV